MNSRIEYSPPLEYHHVMHFPCCRQQAERQNLTNSRLTLGAPVSIFVHALHHYAALEWNYPVRQPVNITISLDTALECFLFNIKDVVYNSDNDDDTCVFVLHFNAIWSFIDYLTIFPSHSFLLTGKHHGYQN